MTDDVSPTEQPTIMLPPIPTGGQSTLDNWVAWAADVNLICQLHEQESRCVPVFAAEHFDAAHAYITRMPATSSASVECGLIFLAMLALRHTRNSITPSEKDKIPFGDYARRQRCFFIEWCTESSTADEWSSREQALLIEAAELCRCIAPNTLWDDYQYIANVPAMASIDSRAAVLAPIDRSSLAAILSSIKRRKLAAADNGAIERRFYCGIDSRTLRWQAGWWRDFWRMRDFDESLSRGARVYEPPENCPYTNHWFLAALREIEWMKETLEHLQERFFDNIALPGMAERGYQRAGFRKHSGNVLWAEFETTASNTLREFMKREALPIYEALGIREHKHDEVEFHWEILRAMFVIITRLLVKRFTTRSIEDRMFVYDMLDRAATRIPRADAQGRITEPHLIGIRQHWVLMHGADRVLYRREHMLHAIADFCLLSFPTNDKIRFLMCAFREEKMISPNDIIAVQSAKIVASDNGSMGFFRE